MNSWKSAGSMPKPWFPYRLTGAIIKRGGCPSDNEPWFPYRLTGAIMT